MFLLSAVMRYSARGKPVRAQIINSRIVKIMLGNSELRDSFAAVPEALGTIGKKEIDYSKLERAIRKNHMPEIVDYLKQDCVSLYDLMAEYKTIVGKQTTIASNAMKFCKAMGIDPGKTNNSFDTTFRDFYYGGRTECFRPGIHKNINIFDIRSAYPTAMCEYHPSGSEHVYISAREFQELPRDEQQRCFIRLECTVSSGCFPVRTKTGLSFPTGRNIFAVTGWEYIAAKELGLLRGQKFLEIIRCTEKITFQPYVAHWYEMKKNTNKKLDPIKYTIAKILLNALYGKLAQNISRYYDYIYVKGGTPVDYQNGWELADEYNDLEIHRREALWRYRQQFGDAWRGRPLYNNVATGASITGLARSYLLKAIHKVGEAHIIYCDTDSLIVDHSAPMNVLPLSNNLGDWELEAANCPIGYFVGKKLYGIDLGNGEKCTCHNLLKKDCKTHKIATKGGKVEFRDFPKLVKGEKVLWQNQAPSFSIAGEPSFVHRYIRSTAEKPMELNN